MHSNELHLGMWTKSNLYKGNISPKRETNSKHLLASVPPTPESVLKLPHARKGRPPRWPRGMNMAATVAVGCAADLSTLVGLIIRNSS